MGKFLGPSIDKRIAAKMFDNVKLNRLREKEIRKVENNRKLMTLKRECMPVIESDFNRIRKSKCNRCNKETETYGVSFEWNLEPIDVLDDDNKGFYGFTTYDSTKRMFSKITNGIIIEPAKIKVMKYLQENKTQVPMIYILKSRDHKLDERLLNFILETYDLQTATSTTGMDENSLQKHLNAHKSLIAFIDDKHQLRNILQCIEFGELKEIYMMPISINTEIQHEGVFNSPILNVMPKHFYQNYGIVKVNLSEPYTCTELVQWMNEADRTEENMYEAIEGHLVHDIAFKRPIFATNILAYVLLTYFRTNGGTIEEIAERMDEIRKEGATTNSIDFSFDGDSMDVAKYAVTKLNNKIIINENLIIRPIEKSAVLFELWDYAETLICHFAPQSILILSAEHYKRTFKYVDYHQMITLAMDFCEVLQLEIPLYKPCYDLRDQLGNAFDMLSRKDLLMKPTITHTENEKRAQRIAEYFDDFDEYDDEYDEYDEESEDLDPANKVTINEVMQKEIDFLKNVTLPIQESYMNVAYTLKRLIGKQVIDLNYFLDLSMNTMLDECLAGNCKYWESCSMRWLKNSMKLFEMWGVIKKVKNSDHLYYITENYDNEEAIDRIAKHIEKFSDY